MLVYRTTERIEAARTLDQCLHGHGFVAQWRSDAEPVLKTLGDETFPGAALVQFREHARQLGQTLDRRHLNEVITDPTDGAIAQYLADQFFASSSLHLQSTPMQGVIWDHKAALLEYWQACRIEVAHRLPHVPAGHPCGRMHGHGYRLTVRVQTSDAAKLSAALAQIQSVLNYRCLNDFAGLDNPTSEMLAVWLWDFLLPLLPSLRSVCVHETPSCGSHFDGRSHGIWKRMRFDSSVQCRKAPAESPYARLHGHTYDLCLHISGNIDTVLGWVMDFGEVKGRFDAIFKRLDHHALHDLPGLANADLPNLVNWLATETQIYTPEVTRIDCDEQPGYGVTWGDMA